METLFELILDKYDGLTICENFTYSSIENFEKDLEEITLKCQREERKLLWIYLNIKDSKLIASCTKVGFEYHTCEKDRLLLVKKIAQNPIIPTASNHTLGAGVVVFNDKNEVLLIKEKHSTIGFKLPGGHIDDGEMIQQAVKREVKEETGIDVEFESIISIGHFHPHQFNKSNLYILCKAKALSHEIDIQDTQEILEACWMDIQTYIQSDETFEYSKAIVQAALEFDGLALEELESFKNIPKQYELFFCRK